MKKITRNKVSGYGIGQLLATAPEFAQKYNEVWYILGNSGMMVNDKGLKGYEQYIAAGQCTAYNPETNSWFIPE